MSNQIATTPINWNGNPTQYVTSLYQNILGHAPDAAGLQYWVNALNNGATKLQEAEAFVNSAEFKAGVTSVNNLTTQIYHDFLDRDPDTGGQNFFNNIINTATNTAGIIVAVADIVNSTEFANLVGLPANHPPII